jgi:hypothetical protein
MSAHKGTRPPNAGKGRKPGVPNKLTADVKEMILGALERVGGEDYLAQQAQENPTAFLSLLGRVLPKQIDAKIEGNFRGYEPLRVPVEQRESGPH